MSILHVKQVTVFHDLVVDMINSGGFLNQRRHRVVISHISPDPPFPIFPSQPKQ